jgi:hypothetical protein
MFPYLMTLAIVQQYIISYGVDKSVIHYIFTNTFDLIRTVFKIDKKQSKESKNKKYKRILKIVCNFIYFYHSKYTLKSVNKKVLYDNLLLTVDEFLPDIEESESAHNIDLPYIRRSRSRSPLPESPNQYGFVDEKEYIEEQREEIERDYNRRARSPDEYIGFTERNRSRSRPRRQTI